MSRYCRFWSLTVLMIFAWMGLALPTSMAQREAGSLRFNGNGDNDIDRLKISLDNPPSAIDVGENFTIEFFMRANGGENSSGTCLTGNTAWVSGNTIIDRDIFGAGDFGDYGISLFGDTGAIAFGVSLGAAGVTLCGQTNVADGEWHHIALTRDNTTGVLQLFVDGTLDGFANGPVGGISYRDGRSTIWPNDPFLVIGAEKHDAGPAYPSYSGWLDELRISTIVRYSSTFTPSDEPFTTDPSTVGLYHFDEMRGNTINDTSGQNNDAVRRFGGNPQGPAWSNETPFVVSEEPGETPDNNDEDDEDESGNSSPSEVDMANFALSVPLCSETNLTADGVIRANLSAHHYEINCRLLVKYGSFVSDAQPAHIGNQQVLDAGVIHAVDVFSPTGIATFLSDMIVCFRGTGQIIFLSSNEAPRTARILTSFLITEYPEHICTSIREPGTLVLVEHGLQ